MPAEPPAFPRRSPVAYRRQRDAPVYDPDLHLALECPERIWTLADLGYPPEVIACCASPVAISTPFRILSPAGVGAAREAALRARQSHVAHSAGERTAAYATGAVYRSPFLRDLCGCPRVAAHLSSIAGVALAPHSMPSQQLYINYAPENLAQAVDNWHFDGIGFDYVLMVSDPRRIKGGRFEFYRGTRDEFAAMHALEVPQVRDGVSHNRDPGRVVTVAFPAAGFGIFQQGAMVVHRAAPLLARAERITLVPGYVALDLDAADPTAIEDMVFYNEPGMLGELVRHGAWLAENKLRALAETLDPDLQSAAAAAVLTAAVEDVHRVLDALRREHPARSASTGERPDCGPLIGRSPQ